MWHVQDRVGGSVYATKKKRTFAPHLQLVWFLAWNLLSLCHRHQSQYHSITITTSCAFRIFVDCNRTILHWLPGRQVSACTTLRRRWQSPHSSYGNDSDAWSKRGNDFFFCEAYGRLHSHAATRIREGWSQLTISAETALANRDKSSNQESTRCRCAPFDLLYTICICLKHNSTLSKLELTQHFFCLTA